MPTISNLVEKDLRFLVRVFFWRNCDKWSSQLDKRNQLDYMMGRIPAYLLINMKYSYYLDFHDNSDESRYIEN